MLVSLFNNLFTATSNLTTQPQKLPKKTSNLTTREG